LRYSLFISIAKKASFAKGSIFNSNLNTAKDYQLNFFAGI